MVLRIDFRKASPGALPVGNYKPAVKAA